MYVTVGATILMITAGIGYSNTKGLYCGSNDLVESLTNGSPFCTFIGKFP